MLAVLDNNDRLVCLTDDYFDSSLHTFLQGTAAFFTCSVLQTAEIAQYFKVGNKLSFVSNEVSYHFDITKMSKNERLVTIQADSLTLELRNEFASEYKSPNAMTFKQYLDVFLFAGDNPLVMGINEVSDKSLQAEWTGDGESTLARLFSLANKFDAEIEFVTVLNKHWGLDKIILNVYRAHSDKYQGIGKKRTDIIMEYGNNVETIEYEENIDDLKTAINPVGTDGLKISSVVIDEKDENGNQLFYSKSGSPIIYAPQSRDRFTSKVGGEGYISKNWTYETTNANVLAGQALAELKKLCEPKVTVTIKGYEYLGIGDTVLVQNTAYVPTLNLSARISEQEIYFDEPSRNSSTFTNVEILQSQVDQSLIDRVNALIEETRPYTVNLVTDNGVNFKNSKGSTTLSAVVYSGTKDITADVTVRWYKDDVWVKTSYNVTVNASDIIDKAVYRAEVMDTNGVIRAKSEVTVFNVDDGRGIKGKPVLSYAGSASIDTVPTTWQATIPNVPSGSYLWTREVTTYSDNTTSETVTPVLQGWKNASGGWTYTGLEAPIDPQENDVWFKPNGSDIETWVYEKGQWVFKTSTAGITEAKQAAENAEAVGNAAQIAANEAKQVADEAKTAGQNAEATANRASTNAQTALNNANNAVDKAAQASQKADNSVTTANEAKTQATTAVTNANTALDNANKAVKDVAGLNQIVTTNTTDIDELEDAIALKADTTTLNAVTGRVSTAEGKITTMAGKIDLKANQTDVDTVSGRVSATEASLTLQDGKITALTSKTDGNTTQISNLQSSYSGLSSTVSTVQSNVQNIDKAVNWQKLTTGQDLNGIKTTGKYFVASGGNTNAPADSGRWFFLSVDNTSGRIKQDYQDDYDITERYFRMSNDNGSTWKNWQRVVNVTEFSSLTQTVSSLQGTVQDKADKSQITQLSNQITSTVTNISIGTNNLISNGAAFQGKDKWFQDYQGDGFILASHEFLMGGKQHMFSISNPDSSGDSVRTISYRFKRNTTYSFSISLFGGNVSKATVYILPKSDSSSSWFDKVIVVYSGGVSGSRVEKKTLTFENTDYDTFYVRVDHEGASNVGSWSQLYWTEVMMVEGNKLPSSWVMSSSETASQSQITQLSDRMNFRITNSDGSITQIDLANKVISLSGEQVNITGNTYIANGVIKTANIADLAVSTAKIADLAVTDAKISSLTANKLTAGTIDANVITVKNISASNITGGTMTADKINGGTINGGNVNLINLNANNISSGKLSAIDITGSTITGSTFETTYNSDWSGRLQIIGATIRGHMGSLEKSRYYPNAIEYYTHDSNNGWENTFRLDPNGITNSNVGYGKRTLAFFSEGLAIAPGSNNTGVTKNSGIRLLGSTSYVDLFSDKSSSGADYSTRLIAESSGNGGINNNKGQFYINANSIALNTGVGITGNLAMNGNNIIGAGNIVGTTGSGGWTVNMINIQGITGTPYLNVTSGSRSWGVTMWASDMRLKKNIQKTAGKAIDIVDKLMVRQFDWRDSDRHTDYGLIAQNVERVLPQAVFNVEQRDSQSIKQISADGVIPVLVQSIQELKQEIETLKAKVA